jgi:adenine-specific DNA-methyltransferase
MDKMRMQTVDITDSNVEKIGQLFPNCITERIGEDGKVERAIDFDQLRQELSKEIVDGQQERYQFTWPDKKKAIRLANSPTSMTLRPCREESVDFDNTENLYIEGDNLEVLKLLREDYLGRIKLIYIDPPYNTGNDFVYQDDFSQTASEYMGNSGQVDNVGNRLVTNSEGNGRFHTDWLNLIYPRLRVAKDLLSNDGVIVLSIDDGEAQNLRKICDEVFGAQNFITSVVWQKIHSIKNDAKYFSENHEYAHIYAKNINEIHVKLLPRTEEMNARYVNPDNDPRGPWQSGDLVASGERTNGHYIVTSPKTGKTFDVPQGKHWVYAQDNLEELIATNQVWFGSDGNAFPRKKRFLSDVQSGRTPSTLWLSEEVGHNQTATRELKALFDGLKLFDFPKPVDYIAQFVRLFTDESSSVLDYFSGSATTAHAVMKLNAEDGGDRKFIMVQLPEPTDTDSEAYKAGFKNLCEIGEERIRRAGKKILSEIKSNDDGGLFSAMEDEKPKLDVGFRVLKLDSSNMNDVYYRPEEFSEQLIKEDNVKEDRNSEDLLFQVMLECNLPLSAKIQSEMISGKEVFSVNNGYLVACFDENVNEEIIKEIAKRKPYYFVMRDSSLSSDNVADNFEQIFQAYSKETIRRIL